LIAIMLGRLRMTTEEAMAAYGEMSQVVFSAKKLLFQDGSFKATVFEDSVKKIIKKFGAELGDAEQDILDTREEPQMCET
jgi:hypothetical protein